MTIDAVPDSIPLSTLTGWLASMGLDASHLRTLRVGRSLSGMAVIAEVFALDSDGRRFVVDEEVATHEVVIPIT